MGKLVAAPDTVARNAVIDGNSAVWGELKGWLLKLSHGKCWFSEAKDCFSHSDVEHYRPKQSAKDTDGTQHEGYWWLAFVWQNLSNRKKGTFFPLREGCARCAALGDHRCEDPQLLDPTDADDPALLSFDFQGRAVPAAHITDEWERERVEYSVHRYNLDFPPLMDKRKTVWAECWDRIQDYLTELDRYKKDKKNAIAKEKCKEAAPRIRALMREEMELSAVARACVLSAGDPRLKYFLTSM